MQFMDVKDQGNIRMVCISLRNCFEHVVHIHTDDKLRVIKRKFQKQKKTHLVIHNGISKDLFRLDTTQLKTITSVVVKGYGLYFMVGLLRKLDLSMLIELDLMDYTCVKIHWPRELNQISGLRIFRYQVYHHESCCTLSDIQLYNKGFDEQIIGITELLRLNTRMEDLELRLSYGNEDLRTALWNVINTFCTLRSLNVYEYGRVHTNAPPGLNILKRNVELIHIKGVSFVDGMRLSDLQVIRIYEVSNSQLRVIMMNSPLLQNAALIGLRDNIAHPYYCDDLCCDCENCHFVKTCVPMTPNDVVYVQSPFIHNLELWNFTFYSIHFTNPNSLDTIQLRQTDVHDRDLQLHLPYVRELIIDNDRSIRKFGPRLEMFDTPRLNYLWVAYNVLSKSFYFPLLRNMFLQYVYISSDVDFFALLNRHKTLVDVYIGGVYQDNKLNTETFIEFRKKKKKWTPDHNQTWFATTDSWINTEFCKTLLL